MQIKGIASKIDISKLDITMRDHEEVMSLSATTQTKGCS